jgi:hypothetical protein
MAPSSPKMHSQVAIGHAAGLGALSASRFRDFDPPGDSPTMRAALRSRRSAVYPAPITRLATFLSFPNPPKTSRFPHTATSVPRFRPPAALVLNRVVEQRGKADSLNNNKLASVGGKNKYSIISEISANRIAGGSQDYKDYMIAFPSVRNEQTGTQACAAN